MTKLDRFDRQLLYELDKDGRQPLSRIARKLRTHRNNIAYRLKRLRATGLIRGFFAEIDIRKLGYLTFRLFLRLSNHTPQQRDALLAHLKKIPQAIWLFRTAGRYDIDLVFAAQTPDEFARFLGDLKDEYNHIIAECKTDLLIQIRHFPKDYLTGRKRSTTVKMFSSGAIELDDTDLRLLHLLAEQATTPLLELAHQLDCDPQTVKRRLKRLEKEHIILGYRPFIDTRMTGHTYHKIHIRLRHYSKNQRLSLLTALSFDPHVIYITEYLNGDDIEAEAHLPAEESIDEFLERLRAGHGSIIEEMHALVFTQEIIFRNLPQPASAQTPRQPELTSGAMPRQNTPTHADRHNPR